MHFFLVNLQRLGVGGAKLSTKKRKECSETRNKRLWASDTGYLDKCVELLEKVFRHLIYVHFLLFYSLKLVKLAFPYQSTLNHLFLQDKTDKTTWPVSPDIVKHSAGSIMK